MSFVIDTSCLYSTVRNTSGVEMGFGFLPPHGRRLAAAESFAVFGNILEEVKRGNGDRDSAKRSIDSFEDAIQRGDIEIVNTPSPLLYDETNDETQMFQLDGGSLSTVDPCWTTSVSVSG